MSRRHAVAIEVGAVLVALSVALTMLGHATGSGAPQWAEGAFATVAVVLGIGALVAVVLLAEASTEVPAWVRRQWRQQRDHARQALQARRDRAARAARRHALTRGRR